MLALYFFCVEVNLLSQTGDCQLVIRAVCSQKSGKRHGLRGSELQTCRPSETNCGSRLRHRGHVWAGIETITETAFTRSWSLYHL
jgi:hypothetical protein